VIVGRHTYGQPIVHRYDGEGEPDIQIGAYCSIAEDVQFLPGGMHQTDRVSTFPWQHLGQEGAPPYLRGSILIGHDVWIGRGARILGGVHIGTGAIIGAYAVVAGSVPAYHVAVGNPARCHPRQSHAPYVPTLLRIGWWDWAADDPRLPDVERMTLAEFCRHYG
jgi:acetyltransferase-like isoleucine patch superfamily enzyme